MFGRVSPWRGEVGTVTPTTLVPTRTYYSEFLLSSLHLFE